LGLACSLGLSATSQQYFSLRTNQPPATSHNQPTVLFSQNKPASAISHQPTKQAVDHITLNTPKDMFERVKVGKKIINHTVLLYIANRIF
jgi:hypothetical protein